MITIKGIHVLGEPEELHELAKKFLISKSWYSSSPTPMYSVVYPYKLQELTRYVSKKKE